MQLFKMAEANLQYISGSKVQEVLRYPDLIPAVENCLRRFSSDAVVQPVRSIIEVKQHEGFFGSMPALCEEDDVLSAKLVTFYPKNMTRYGVATHNAIIALFDTKTGVPTAIMDGEVITTMRTAAASAVATKYLAPQNSSILAILGAGVQARSHYCALSSLIEFKEVRVWSRTFENAQRCAEEIGGTACSTAQEAVKDADIIVTVTGAVSPFLKSEWVKKGSHINAVGACRHNWSEIEPDLMTSSRVYVDSREAALKESGDVILSKAEIYAEIGEVIHGTKQAFREETTVFKSLGLGIEDGTGAKLVLNLLQQQTT